MTDIVPSPEKRQAWSEKNHPSRRKKNSYDYRKKTEREKWIQKSTEGTQQGAGDSKERRKILCSRKRARRGNEPRDGKKKEESQKVRR